MRPGSYPRQPLSSPVPSRSDSFNMWDLLQSTESKENAQ